MPAKKKPDAWPSVEDQLASAHVVHGSALDKLIRDHQDLQMLRPEEAHDELELPPWLRVYWRKHHPKGDYSMANPCGGYPRMLRRVLEWMLMHQDLHSAGHTGGALRS